MQTRYGQCMKAKVNIQVGKNPSLHLFHTTVRQCMGVFLKHTTSSQLLLAVQGYIFNVLFLSLVHIRNSAIAL